MYTIYRKSDCSSCQQAVVLLEMEDIPYEYKKLGVDYTLESLMKISPIMRSFPLVATKGGDGNEVVIGGYKDLVEHLCITLN